ncbi:unnamed protein product [Enterobius vermicularis]|uniref:7TM_GPCR_Srx domain-containing protein n=1 Tax=Enterobius vermicularis TaxID=51028 RepID=A0A0N4UUY1_ENTVE|nr:unnamed protein product [Enterobius vermicularis]
MNIGGSACFCVLSFTYGIVKRRWGRKENQTGPQFFKLFSSATEAGSRRKFIELVIVLQIDCNDDSFFECLYVSSNDQSYSVAEMSYKFCFNGLSVIILSVGFQMTFLGLFSFFLLIMSCTSSLCETVGLVHLHIEHTLRLFIWFYSDHTSGTLLINYKLKPSTHLPWRILTNLSINFLMIASPSLLE